MVHVDATGLIEFIVGGSSRAQVERLLLERDCSVNAVQLAEVDDVCERVHTLPRHAARDTLQPLTDSRLRIQPVAAELGRTAGELRATHYHGRDRDLSLADCILLASAGPGDSIATGDRAVLDTAAELGIETVELS